MDKISGFPDEILVKILSFLPTKAAVSTSILSKRWKFLWMWLPKLDYLDDYHESLVDFINKNLPLHRAPVIESLRLEPSSRHTKPEDFKLWIEIAVSRYVRELEVSFNSGHSINIFPSCLFSCKSLVILKLEYVDLVDVPSMVCLPSLKSLLLNEVYTDGKTLQQLLFICPVLDDLDLTLFEYSEKMEEFTVSVPSLQKLSLSVPIRSVSDGYEIDSPSLKYLKLKGRNHVEHYSLFKHMPKLTEAYINVESGVLTILVGAITSVKHLTLCGEDVYGDGFVFNQLEHLKLCVCHKDSSNLLAQLLKDSPNLQVLDIYMLQGHGWAGHNSMVCWNQQIHVPECMLSSLQIFKWSRYFGRPQDRDIAVYILKNARHLKTATILADTTKQNVSNLKMIKELTLSSRASTKCELVFVDDRSDDSSDDSSDDNRT